MRFDPRWGGPEKPVTFDKLEDCSKWPEPGVRYYSGSAVYRTAFNVSHPAQPNARGFLNLGTIKNVAEVRLNGSVLGTVWCAP